MGPVFALAGPSDLNSENNALARDSLAREPWLCPRLRVRVMRVLSTES